MSLRSGKAYHHANDTSDTLKPAPSGAGSGEDGGSWPVIYGIAVATVKTIFALDQSVSIHRTAIFLMTFLLIHMLGNLWVFSGPDAFNT
jgi:hypothetical protein